MPRDLPLGNGRLLVNFDKSYNLRDIYWPHVGQDLHTAGDISHMTWSHAEYILTVRWYIGKYHRLQKA